MGKKLRMFLKHHVYKSFVGKAKYSSANWVPDILSTVFFILYKFCLRQNSGMTPAKSFHAP